MTSGFQESSPRRARAELVLYFVLLVASSAFFEGQLIRGSEFVGQENVILALMWCPGVSAILVRLLFRSGFRDVSLSLGRSRSEVWKTTKALAVATAYPILVGALAYGVAWWIGLAPLGLENMPESDRPHLAEFFGRALWYQLTLGAPSSIFRALGEELGWRGFMLTRLERSGLRYPVTASSLIWAAWHWPLILAGLYASSSHPSASVALFTATILGLSFMSARLRLSTGSVWPSVVLHALWNNVIQDVFDQFSEGTRGRATFWVGESGVCVALSAALVAWALSKFVRGRAPDTFR